MLFLAQSFSTQNNGSFMSWGLTQNGKLSHPSDNELETRTGEQQGEQGTRVQGARCFYVLCSMPYALIPD